MAKYPCSRCTRGFDSVEEFADHDPCATDARTAMIARTGGFDPRGIIVELLKQTVPATPSWEVLAIIESQVRAYTPPLAAFPTVAIPEGDAPLQPERLAPALADAIAIIEDIDRRITQKPFNLKGFSRQLMDLRRDLWAGSLEERQRQAAEAEDWTGRNDYPRPKGILDGAVFPSRGNSPMFPDFTTPPPDEAEVERVNRELRDAHEARPKPYRPIGGDVVDLRQPQQQLQQGVWPSEPYGSRPFPPSGVMSKEDVLAVTESSRRSQRNSYDPVGLEGLTENETLQSIEKELRKGEEGRNYALLATLIPRVPENQVAAIERRIAADRANAKDAQE
jgi:hypothetical protein